MGPRLAHFSGCLETFELYPLEKYGVQNQNQNQTKQTNKQTNKCKCSKRYFFRAKFTECVENGFNCSRKIEAKIVKLSRFSRPISKHKQTNKQTNKCKCSKRYFFRAKFTEFVENGFNCSQKIEAKIVKLSRFSRLTRRPAHRGMGGYG